MNTCLFLLGNLEFSNWSDPMASNILVDLIIKSFLLLTVTLIMTLMMRKRSAATVHRIWTLGFIGCLAIPVITLIFPVWSLAILPSSWFETNSSNEKIERVEPIVSKVKPSIPKSNIPLSQQDNIVASRISNKSSSAHPPENELVNANKKIVEKISYQTEKIKLAAIPKPKDKIEIDLKTYLFYGFIVWGVGAIFFFFQILRYEISLRRIIDRSFVIEDETWLKTTANASRSLSLGQSVKLRKVDDLQSPIISGLFRSSITLPANADTWSELQRQLVLLHELAHAKRKDVLTQTIARFVCSFMWVNPICWIGLFQMRKLREIACDDLVLTCTEKPSDYASVLLNIARNYQHQKLTTALGMASTSHIENRITFLLDNARSRVSLSRKAARNLMISLAAMVLLIGSMNLQSQQEKELVVALKQSLTASGKVTDAITGKPIKEIKVIPVILFRPDLFHTSYNRSKVFKNGTYKIQLDQGQGRDGGYQYTIRVEAEGYRSVLSDQFYFLDDRNIKLDISMEPAKALEGTVVDKDGKSVEGASVVLGTPTVVPMIVNGKVRIVDVIETSKDGRFQIAASSEPIRVHVTHQSGYANVLRKVNQPIGTIQLKPWSKVTGRLIQDGEPVPNQIVLYSPSFAEGLKDPRFQVYYNAETNVNGEFNFNKIPPVAGSFRVQLGPGRESVLTSSQSLAVDLKPGKHKVINLGGDGITVTGKIISTGREDVPLDKNWSLNHLIKRDGGIPLPKEFPVTAFDPSEAVQISWTIKPNYYNWLKTRQNYFVKPASDGQFRISGVPAGQYDLVFKLYEKPAGCLVNTIGQKIVPIHITEADIKAGKKEIGDIEVACKIGPQIGHSMNDYKFTDVNGRERSIQDMKGKYVMMHVWASWCAPCIASMPNILTTVQNYQGKPIKFIGFNVDEDKSAGKTLALKKKLDWHQTYLGGDSSMAQQLAFSSVPVYYLIGPDGNLTALSNKWSEIKLKLESTLNGRKIPSEKK